MNKPTKIEMNGIKNIKIDKAYENFIKFCKVKNLSSATIEYYNGCWDKFLRFFQGDLQNILVPKSAWNLPASTGSLYSISLKNLVLLRWHIPNIQSLKKVIKQMSRMPNGFVTFLCVTCVYANLKIGQLAH